MSQPTVACVMLVNGRAEMVKRAVASFDQQTYANACLVVLDSGKKQTLIVRNLRDISHTVRVNYIGGISMERHTIGSLRNLANGLAHADLIAHFDSDDWSHPNRLAEQVALLESTGADCVGYREVLFWDTRVEFGVPGACIYPERPYGGEAWLYSDPDPHALIGASMLYRREAWERCPFDDAPHEDRRWWLVNKSRCRGVSSFQHVPLAKFISQARMVCGIHGQNTEAYDPAKMRPSERGPVAKRRWWRVPDWDPYCAEAMKL